MNEEHVQIIAKDGEPEYAVIPIKAYRRMAAALEDAEDAAAIDRAWADDAAGETVPGNVAGRQECLPHLQTDFLNKTVLAIETRQEQRCCDESSTGHSCS